MVLALLDDRRERRSIAYHTASPLAQALNMLDDSIALGIDSYSFRASHRACMTPSAHASE